MTFTGVLAGIALGVATTAMGFGDWSAGLIALAVAAGLGLVLGILVWRDHQPPSWIDPHA
jgi:ribose/xylose/arabinose/galactoside ABC-type transport system permease subunit